MFTYRQEDFFDFAYHRARGLATTSDHVKWADALLVAGCEAPSVATLASCIWDRDPDARQVEQLFHECLADLGLTLLADADEEFDTYIKAVSLPICEQILSGTMAPEAGLARLLEICDDNYEPLLLWLWVDLANDLDPWYEGHITYNEHLDLTDRDGCIRATATQFAKLCTLALPDRFPWVWQCRECSAVNDENTCTQEPARVCPECKTPLAMRNMRFFTNRALLVAGTFGA